MDPEKARRFRRNVLRFDEPTPSHERVSKWVQDFANRVYHNLRGGETPWLILLGKPGTGKTHLANATAEFIGLSAVDLWHAGKWPAIPTVANLGWPSLVGKDGAEVFREAEAADLLVVDEIGAEVDRFKTGEPTEVLRRLLSRREGRWTILTSNVPQSEWIDRWDARIASRLSAGKTLLFDSLPDRRPLQGA